jgi:DNA-binding response OmpR family regulator
MNILIVEDDTNVAELIAIHLKNLPANVKIVQNGWAGLDAAVKEKYDLIVLDVMLPGLNGLDVCKRIRAYNHFLPILILTAKSEELDKITGLELGADDYMTKPFSVGELIARVKSILRRTKNEKNILHQEKKRIEKGDLVLDLEHKAVYLEQKRIELTLKEFELLTLFMLNTNRSFSRQEILDRVWGEQFEGLEHTVNSHINRLRNKIEKDLTKPQYILTAWGIGYKFNSEL